MQLPIFKPHTSLKESFEHIFTKFGINTHWIITMYLSSHFFEFRPLTPMRFSRIQARCQNLKKRDVKNIKVVIIQSSMHIGQAISSGEVWLKDWH